MSPTGLSLLWFVAIVGLIPMVLWLVKRGAPASLIGARGTAPARLVGTLPLGPQQRIVTIETGHGEHRQWLVLGVTPQSITTLQTLAPPETPAVDTTPGPTDRPFAALLDQFRGPRT